MSSLPKDSQYSAQNACALLNLKQVAEYLHVSPKTITRMRDRGEFPQPTIQSNHRQTRWSLAKIQAWIERQDQEDMPVEPRKRRRVIDLEASGSNASRQRETYSKKVDSHTLSWDDVAMQFSNTKSNVKGVKQ